MRHLNRPDREEMENAAPRIVSLLGSATEIVYELGLQEYLVGISHECDHPPEALALPRVSRPRFDPGGLTSGEIDAAVRRAMREHGSVYEVDRRLLEVLRPTVVLTQAICEVCAVPTGSVEEAVSHLGPGVRVESLDAHTLDDILLTMHQVADAAGEPRAAEAAVARLRDRLDAVRARVDGALRPRTLLLEWLDPPFAPGHWVPEMVELAGGENLLGSAGERSREVAPDDLKGLDPEVVLIEPCGFGLDEAARDAERNRDLLAGPAGALGASGGAWLLHSAWFSRSGPRVVEGVETLARLLHPDRFPGIELSGRARRWP
jgi:iron complex transport system substrate-binding protein